ncbi:MAG: phospholipase D family protein [Kiritimatiellaeota bacterium]|nr:phospholipase D family protein [Kiritimatiellota bacterium]
MQQRLGIFLLAGWLAAGAVCSWSAPKLPATVEIFYSPHGGCTEAIVNTLHAAKQTIFVQAYSFTSSPIEAALAAAAKRGVKVRLILDRSNLTQKSSEADDAAAAGLPVLIDAKHEIAHNKIIIVDGETVITGSFNFSRNAEENNAENLLIIRSKDVAARYTANWHDHAKHSDPYEADAPAKPKKTEHATAHKSLWPFR